jgi:hypothetical protein
MRGFGPQVRVKLRQPLIGRRQEPADRRRRRFSQPTAGRAPMTTLRRIALGAGLALTSVLHGCGGGDGGTAPPPAATTGTLQVTLSGLPADVTGSVSITGPAGYTSTVTTTQTLSNLAPGSYVVTPVGVADRSVGYAAAAVTVTVTAGATTQSGAAYALKVLPRSTTNRADVTTLSRVKVMYALPSDGTDRNLDTDGTLHRTISSGQRWLAGQTANRSFRYDVADGGLDIAFVRLPRTDAQYYSYNGFIRDSIEKDMKAAGWNQANVLLLVYYDGRHIDRCASAAWPPALPGNVGAIYLKGLPNAANGCALQPFAASATAAPGYIDFTALHELFHLIGAVSTSAPNHALSGHVGNDPTDLMYAGNLAWRPAVVDITKTNYYSSTSLTAGVTNFKDSPYVVTP